MHTERIEDGRTTQVRKPTWTEGKGEGGRVGVTKFPKVGREPGWPATRCIASEAQGPSKGQHFFGPSVDTHYSFATRSSRRKEEK